MKDIQIVTNAIGPLVVACGICAVSTLTIACSSSSVGTADDEVPGAHDADSPCEKLQRQADEQPIIEALLKEHLSDDVRQLVENPEQHRLQLLVSEIAEVEGERCLIEHGFRVDAEYFYPGNAIHAVGAIAALQLLEEQAMDAPWGFDDVLWFHEIEDFDDPEQAGAALSPAGSLRNIIEQTLIISSTEGFNQLFDLVGQQRINQSMWNAGLESLRLQHRIFSWRTSDQERWTPKVSIAGNDDESSESESLQRLQPQQESHIELPPIDIGGLKVGQSHIEFGHIRGEPMDFSTKNYLSLRDHQKLMLALYQPGLSPLQLPTTDDHRAFVTEAMGVDPESFADDLGHHAERHFKPTISGFAQVIPRERLSYFNKTGRSHGFHVENAYVADSESDRSLFLSAVVYVNENERINDDIYEYDELSFPFYEELGALVARKFLLSEDDAPLSDAE